jgi:hypothetical protein
MAAANINAGNPNYASLGAGHAYMCETWAQAETARNQHNFKQAVDNWRLNAPILKSLKKPIPPPPNGADYMIVTCDRDLAARRYAESLLSGEPIVIDYFTYTAQVAPPGSFDIGVEPKRPLIDNPVGNISKRPHCWDSVDGDAYPVGHEFDHPEIGKMKKISIPNAIGYRFFWRAATSIGKLTWEQEAEDRGWYQPD